MNASQIAYAELGVNEYFTTDCYECGWQLEADKSNFGEHDQGCF